MQILVPLKAAFGRADPALVALALAMYIVSVPIVALRWGIVLRAVTGTRVSLRPLVLASLASSFVNNVTPLSRLGGEGVRVILPVQLGLTTTGRATAAVAYERLSEAPALALLAAATLYLAGRASRVLATAGVAAAGLAVCLYLLRPAIGRWWRRATDRWRHLAAFEIPPAALARSAAMSGLVWALDVGRLASIAAAFGAPLGVLQAATLCAITVVAGWVPIPGGLGAVEGGLMAGLVAFGVTAADAAAITIVERAMSFGLSSGAGAMALSVLGGRRLWHVLRLRPPAPADALP